MRELAKLHRVVEQRDRAHPVLRCFGTHISRRHAMTLSPDVETMESYVAAHLSIHRRCDVIVLDVDNSPKAMRPLWGTPLGSLSGQPLAGRRPPVPDCSRLRNQDISATLP